jgi:hypothetical protein
LEINAEKPKGKQCRPVGDVISQILVIGRLSGGRAACSAGSARPKVEPGKFSQLFLPPDEACAAFLSNH